MAVASIAAGHCQRRKLARADVAPTAPDWNPQTNAMPRRKPEPPEVAALRLAIAATIAALLKAPDEAEYRRLIAERNRLGRELAALLKASEQTC